MIPLILISHNMRQVFDLVDRIVVFRRGRICANLRKEETNGEDVVAYITGARTQAEYADADLRSERWTPPLPRSAMPAPARSSPAGRRGWASPSPERLVAEGCARLVLAGRDADKGRAAAAALAGSGAQVGLRRPADLGRRRGLRRRWWTRP